MLYGDPSIITARVRSTMDGNNLMHICLSVYLSIHTGGRGYHNQVSPRLVVGGVPLSFLMGVPHLFLNGYPPFRTGCCTPPSVGTEWGYPQLGLDEGTPQLGVDEDTPSGLNGVPPIKTG